MIDRIRRKSRRESGRQLAIASLAAAGFCLALSAAGANAQSIDFQVDNISLEQVTSSQPAQPSAEALALASGEPGGGSNTIVLQRGNDNTAATGVTGSPGSAIASLQFGESNQNYAVIQDSPGSSIGTVQIGSNNTMATGIVGGSGNTIGAAQVGNNLGLAVGLVNSTDTTVIYGQGGQNYNGGIVIKNAPPGTVVKLN